MVFTSALKFTNHLGYFSNKICHQEIPKIAQSCHAGQECLKSEWTGWQISSKFFRHLWINLKWNRIGFKKRRRSRLTGRENSVYGVGMWWNGLGIFRKKIGLQGSDQTAKTRQYWIKESVGTGRVYDWVDEGNNWVNS